MLKLAVAVLAVALAGTASADNWRKLKVDASSEAAFEKSLAVFKEELSPARRYVFGEALKDIWTQGAQEAAAAQREYTASDYYRHVDGLSYEEITTFTDPTGKTAKTRYNAASRFPGPAPRASGSAATSASALMRPMQGQRPPGGWGTTNESIAQGMQQCHCLAPNGQQGQ
jgi:hypothetical protein